MHVLLDALLVSAFALFVLRGYSRGLSRSVLGLGRTVLSFAVTALLGSSFARWINQGFVYPRVYSSVRERLSHLASDVTSISGGGLEALADRLPKVFRQYLEMDAIDPTEKVSAVVEKWSLTVADGISKVVSTVLGFVLLFLLAYLALTVVMTLVRGLVKLPIIRTVDKLLGLGGGILSGMIAVFVLSTVLGAVCSLLGQGDTVENSLLLRLFTGLKERVFT